MLIKAIDYKCSLIFQDPGYGDQITKKIYPKKYLELYNIKNLFRVELPAFWRMLYTIKQKETQKTILILDILDHNDYNKLFGYKKR
ncbi:MAG: hypothetical protein Q7R96_02845 [Nanoarchaeota archaeon]|nr:hypothetical protein [Nanoarchaeota archaeon]